MDLLDILLLAPPFEYEGEGANTRGCVHGSDSALHEVVGSDSVLFQVTATDETC